MTQGQSSIKGRGTEILVGVPKAVQVNPVGSDPAMVEPEPLKPESPDSQPTADPMAGQAEQMPSGPPEEPAPPTDAELSTALYAEARDGESGPVEQDHWIMESEWPPRPEAEMALFEEPVEVQGPPPAIAEASSQPVEENVEEEVIPAELLEPEVSSTAPPGPVAAQTALEPVTPQDDYDIQSPAEPVRPVELPERPLTEKEKKELGEMAGARIQALDQEIDQIYEQVLTEVGENESIATECFNLLLKARDIVMRRDVSRMPQAEYYVGQARARLKRASVSALGARKNAWWILAWGFLWGMIFVALLILLDSQWTQDLIALLDLHGTFVDPSVLLPAMIWGGVGGVVAIWYSLFKHVANRDFDRYYNISYVGKPFFGLILGATVYMVIHLLIVSLGVWPASLPEGTQQSSTHAIAPWIIYLLAWVTGFKENRVFGLVDQVMKRIFSTTESAAPSSTS